jgi:transposase
VAAVKKNAAREGRTIVFIDEAGLSERPHRVRTWAPRGQTPVLQLAFNWKRLSVIAGVTVWTFYFRLYPGSIKSPQLVDFLRHLRRQLRRKVLIIWDGLKAHRSRLVQTYVEASNGMLRLAFLPAYAPELNPVEYVWGYCKQHELANFCPNDLAHLGGVARRRLRSMQRRRTLVTAFWEQAHLPFDDVTVLVNNQ